MVFYGHYGRQLCWPPAIMFYCCSLDLSIFSLPILQGRLADRHQTLPHVMVTQIYKILSEIWMAPSLRKLAAQKHQNFGAISHNFWT